MKSIRSYENVSDGIVDVMTHGCKRVVRLSQTDVRIARSLLGDDLPDYFAGSKAHKGVLAVAVFNKSADFARLSAEHALIWVMRKFGSDAIENFAFHNLGMTRAAGAEHAGRLAGRPSALGGHR